MTGDQHPLDSNKNLTERLDIDFALRAAGLGVWEIDPVTNKVYWDDRCRALVGLDKDDTTPFDEAIQYIHPDDLGTVMSAIQRAMTVESGGRFDQTYRTLGADGGRLRWVRFWGQAYFSPSGTLHRFSGVAQEVTELVVARQELEESELFARAIFEYSPTAKAVFVGQDMVVRTVNKSMLAMWGRDTTAIGRPFMEVMPELVSTGELERFRHVLNTGERFYQAEEKFELLRYGLPYTGYYEYTYEPLRSASGTIYGVMCVALDVTKQVKARQQLAEREAQLHSIVQQTPAPTLVLRGDEYRIDQINPPMLALIGRGEEVLGQPLLSIMPELAGQFAWQQAQRVYREGVDFDQAEVPVPHMRNGVQVRAYYAVSYRPLREEGQITGMIQVAIDITEQVKARRALNESQAALESTIDLAELGSYRIDVATNQLTKSPRLADWYGLPERADISLSLNAIVESDRNQISQVLADALKPGSTGSYQIDYTVVNQRTGQQRVLRTTGQVQWDSAGQPISIYGSVLDITTQRTVQLALEQQVQQRTEELAANNEELAATNEELAANNEEYAAINEELEEANTLLLRSNDNLQTFAYIASHDLQEPLRKIQQFGDLLKTRLTGSVGDEEMTYLERMQVAASRMSTLIRDLLSYSRISTQRNTDQSVPLDDVLRDVLSVLELTITETKAQVQVDALPVVSGDSSQLGQLFQNLLSNALKFRRPDAAPRIRVSSQTVSIDELPSAVRPARRTPTYHRIEVADNGIGFDEKYLDRIFQVFQRLHGKSQYVGTGVGLAICEKVVTNHGGTITAHSQPGQGTTFVVYLPAS